MTTSQNTEREWFNSRYVAEYKMKTGVFRIFDYETKQRTEVKSITFLNVCRAYMFEKSMTFSSRLFSSLKTDVITTFGREQAAHGNFIYSMDDKCLVDEKGKMSKFHSQGLTTLVLCGVLRNGETIRIQITGTAKRDLEILQKDERNANKIETLEKRQFIKLFAEEKTVKVTSKSGGMSSIIHLIDVEENDTEIDEDFKEKAKEVLRLVKAETGYQNIENFIDENGRNPFRPEEDEEVPEEYSDDGDDFAAFEEKPKPSQKKEEVKKQVSNDDEFGVSPAPKKKPYVDKYDDIPFDINEKPKPKKTVTLDEICFDDAPTNPKNSKETRSREEIERNDEETETDKFLKSKRTPDEDYEFGQSKPKTTKKQVKSEEIDVNDIPF